MDQSDIQVLIDEASAGVANESLDLSVSEIVNLHRVKDILISPAFQRLFRWEDEQQSRLVESLILGLPIPQLFLFQREDGVLELVDGLQRVSSIIRFVDYSLLDESVRDDLRAPLKLKGCDLLEHLNGNTFEDFPVAVRRDFLRKSIRAIVIKRTNKPTLRYEMFKRLNSGGSPAEYQEIRNAQIRILGKAGEEFLDFIDQCASFESFRITTETLPDTILEKQGRQELVLRFLAGIHRRPAFKGNVAEWIDGFTEAVLISKTISLDFKKEKDRFEKTFKLIADKLGTFAFVKYRDGKPIGGLAPAYFEAVSLAVCDKPSLLADKESAKASKALAKIVESKSFREVTGPGANSLPKLNKRIMLISTALDNA